MESPDPLVCRRWRIGARIVTDTDMETNSRQENEFRTASERRSQRRSAPPSGAGPPSNDADTSGTEIDLDKVFGPPVLSQEDGRESPFEVDAPDDPPNRLEKAVYDLTFQRAFGHPHAITLAMRGIRKSLKRGKEAADRAGGQEL